MEQHFSDLYGIANVLLVGEGILKVLKKIAPIISRVLGLMVVAELMTGRNAISGVFETGFRTLYSPQSKLPGHLYLSISSVAIICAEDVSFRPSI